MGIYVKSKSELITKHIRYSILNKVFEQQQLHENDWKVTNGVIVHGFKR